MVEAIIFDWTHIAGRKNADVKELLDFFRKRGIRIGSTSQCGEDELKQILALAEQEGNVPDYAVCAAEVSQGRPKPFMIWKNLMEFGVSQPLNAVKVAFSAEEVKEGIQAGLWTVGVISRFSQGLFSSPREREMEARKQYHTAQADYVIQDIWELSAVISDINYRAARLAGHTLLTPGPVTTRRRVKQSMMADHCSWDEEYRSITRSVIDDLTAIYADDGFTTVLLQGSGTYGVESMIQSLCRDGERILFLVNGEYGKRMVSLAERAGKTFSVLEFPPCRGIDPDQVEGYLARNPGIRTVMFVHCETSSGVMNPAREITAAAKARGKQVLIDCISSFGVYELPLGGPLGADAVAACANVCLEGTPGIAFVVAKKEILEKAKDVAHSLCMDLHLQYREFSGSGGKFRFTSPTNILLALRQAIDEYRKEGEMAARRQRYEENRQTLAKGMKRLGIRSIVREEDQSCIAMTFELGALDFANLYHFLRRRGFVIDPGKLTRISTFRIGTCGNLNSRDIENFCLAMEDYLQRAGEMAERN